VAPVEVTDDLMPGVVSLPHGWGHDVEDTRLSVAKAHPGVNANALTDDRAYDEASGTARNGSWAARGDSWIRPSDTIVI